jgi:hypothetical protein|nr:MAG TPA: hypothetical protein [Caudoviricetes sp.]
MKNFAIVNTISRSVHKAGLKFKKHSPEIMVVAGVVGVVTSTVMACKATTKVNDILEETKKQVDDVHNVLESESVPAEEYTSDDAKKDLAIIYTQTGVKLIKLYGPAVLVGALSITGILASHRILKKRNVALTAAYATIDRSFKEYRGRVVERFGKELDRELRYNIKAQEIKEVTVDKDGKETVEKKTVGVVDPNMYSDYARIFDEYCSGWTKDPEYNLMFLKSQQNYANDKLKAQGYLFLNDVYYMLGIPRTKAGQIVGWVYDPDNTVGDNFVDFGIYDIYNEKACDFVNGRERSIILDFNVDGNILDMI